MKLTRQEMRFLRDALKRGAIEVSSEQGVCPDSSCHVNWAYNGYCERNGNVQVLQCTCGAEYVSILKGE